MNTKAMNTLKLLTVLLVVLSVQIFSAPTWAQVDSAPRSLWNNDPEPVFSPIVHPDRKVTFRLRAPNAKSVSVKCFVIGMNQMQQDSSGIWTYTTPKPLDPDLYSYAFVVDDVRLLDPANAYISLSYRVNYSMFLVPGPESECYQVNDVPHGSMTRCWYLSQAVGHERRMVVYTPPSYEASKERYPVLYLMHGYSGDEEDWPNEGRIAQILDNLIARGKAKPMIVVMPNNKLDQDAAPGNDRYGWLMPPMRTFPRNGDGAYEQNYPEIVKYIDNAYRTIPEKSSRAIAGFSMGAFHAGHISKAYPDMFDYVGLFSGCIVKDDQDKAPIYNDFDGKLARQFAKPPKLYWIAIGSADSGAENARKLHEHLASLGYKSEFKLLPGDHDAYTMRREALEFIPKLFY
jgi:enterochelin esterase family protein